MTATTYQRRRAEMLLRLGEARRKLTIDDALLLDDGAGEEGLADVLGDRWLVAHNPIVRNVRRVFGKLGFQLSATSPHRGLPGLALPELLRTRTVGYVANAGAVQSLAAARPNRFTVAELLSVGLVRNVVTHESVHCIAHALRAYPDNASGSEPEARRRYVMTTQIGEASAHAAELVGSAFCDEDTHAAFYSINHWLFAVDKTRDRLLRLLDALGLADTYRVAQLGYLAAGFLWEEPDDDAIDALLAHGPTLATERLRKAGRVVVRQACELDLRARINGPTLHYRSLGIDEDLGALFDFDFIKELERAPRYPHSLKAIADYLG